MLARQLRKTATLFLMASSAAAFAGDKEKALIDKTVAAYGGDALLELKTLRFNDNYKSFRRGQSRNPAEVDQVSYSTSTTIDFTNRRKSLQSVGGIYVQGLYVQHAFYDGETGYRVWPSSETFVENPRMSFARADGGQSWRSDLVLVKLLSEVRDSAVYQGEGTHRGRPQQVISFQAEGYPEFVLYIDKETGLVSKMMRPDRSAGSSYSYIFGDYRQQDGLTFAADTYVTRSGVPESLTATRSYVFGGIIDDAYRVPAGYTAPAAMMDDSAMMVRELADGVYQAGKEGGFSIFIDAGDYFIASGGYPGLAERYATVKAFSGTDKPLCYQIVTHHHDDHIEGLKEVADLGTIFIVAASHMDAVRAAIPAALPDDRFLITGQDTRYADGLVQVVDIASWHADHNLVIYIPAAKLAFSADHFFSIYERGAPDSAEMYAQFKTALENHGVNAGRFAAVHSGRLLTRDDLIHSSTAPFVKLKCPTGWDFCSR